MSADYKSMSLKELQGLAKGRGIKRVTRVKKQDLIELLDLSLEPLGALRPLIHPGRRRFEFGVRLLD